MQTGPDHPHSYSSIDWKCSFRGTTYLGVAAPLALTDDDDYGRVGGATLVVGFCCCHRHRCCWMFGEVFLFHH